ncbi:MAG: 7-cyano-7-deazaguanine synthase QueC [Bacteriovoracales bacterium]|nr:7-cyano-7-deazaguanine synthase QueC [Bacteriovoracales bacterium]
MSSSNDNDLAICLVSGGMDSLVSAAIASTKHSSLAFLHLRYGQKTQKKEAQCFHLIADHYRIPSHRRKVIDMEFFKQIGGSSLTDENIHVKTHDFTSTEPREIPDSYVPFRNTHIVAMAVSWAEILGAKSIYIGAVAEDSSGYPDCRPDYYRALNQLIKEGTKEGVIQVKTPLISLSKKEIVLKAHELGAPLELTWSCYQNDETACGICESCFLRLRGFREAFLKDPLPYL